MQIKVKDVKSKLGSLIDRVEAGEEIIITRRGKEAARLVPPKSKVRHLPPLADFRSSIRITGESLGTTVIRIRKEERY